MLTTLSTFMLHFSAKTNRTTSWNCRGISEDSTGSDKVLKKGNLVGVTTSRGYSYYFRQMISLCTIDVEHSEPGTDVSVIWGNSGEPQKEIRAKVAPAPYKQDRGRGDLTKL